jgi:hypothetical protein
MITVYYAAVDGYQRNRDFAELKDARAWAQELVGETPELGSYYAISSDGIGKVQVEGAKLHDLFPRAERWPT